MQNARDTFYVTLRDRLAAVNPARTIVLRGLVRPGVLVEENELVSAALPADAFCLHWTTLSVDAQGALPLVTMECAITYATAWRLRQRWDGSRTAAGCDGCGAGHCREHGPAERREDELRLRCGRIGRGSSSDGDECVLGRCNIRSHGRKRRAAGARGHGCGVLLSGSG
jgi:hypothetical protein